MTAFFKRRKSAIRLVLPFAFRHWRQQPLLGGFIAVCVLIATVADVFVPLFAGHLVDAVASGAAADDAARKAAITAFAAIVGLGAVQLVFRFLGFYAITPFTLRLMAQIGHDAFNRVQRFSTDWHANTFAGSTVRKITRGMWGLDTLDDVIFLSLLPSAAVLIGSTVLLALHWPLLGAVISVGAIAYIFMTAMLSTRYIAPAARHSNVWDTKIGGTLADALTCNAVVKSFGAEAREDVRFDRVVAQWRKRVFRTWQRYTKTSSTQLTALLFVRTGVIGGALLLWMNGQASPGDVAYVLTSYFVIHGYLRDVGQHINNLQRSVNDMEELVTIHDQTIGIADAADAKPIAIRDGQIVFDDVTFHYVGHDTPLYDRLNVTIDGGERIGLVGRSGSGKTTFVKLVQRLYDVNKGRVLIDGQDVAHATQASLRSQIALVQQEPILFHRSLAENIAYAKPGAPMEKIIEAAKLANAHEFIEVLPKGYATLVGERGVKLSGGERQRVALARAFLADAPVLILDEATSSLDSESEALIQEAMERLMKGRTAIVIAHRLSTVRSLDRILVFDHGRVAEEGTHDDLAQRDGGIYRALFERQAMEVYAVDRDDEAAE